MGSFILHRNAYLDGDIQTTESQLFKQHPKLGKDPRPNPNTNNQQAVAEPGNSNFAFLRQYNSQKQLVTASGASQLSHHSGGGRLSSPNTATPIQVEDITTGPPTIQTLTSGDKPNRKLSVKEQKGHKRGGSGGRKAGEAAGQDHGQVIPRTNPKPQINTLAGPPEYQPHAQRAVTTMAESKN